jgi:hypothetical protein
MISPDGRAQFQVFIDGARVRTVADLKALHVFKRPDGTYLSLDIGVVGPDFESLMGLVSAAVLQMAPDRLVPMQPVLDWWAFWISPFIKTYMGYRCPLYKHSRVFVIVRGGEWPK